MFDMAQYRLYQEIDILTIIRNQRMNHFLSSSIKQPHHEALIHWFKDYFIGRPDPNDSNADSDSEIEAIKTDPTLCALKHEDHPDQTEIDAANRIAAVLTAKASMKGGDYPKMLDFIKREKIILQLYSIIAHFDPVANEMDRVALRKIFRDQCHPDMTDEEIDTLTNGFKTILRADVDML